jgi:putative tricarboxylic transport membrane protein
LCSTALKIKKTGPTAAAEAKKTDVDNRAILLTFVLFVYYFFALHPLGYILCSIIYLILQMLVLAGKPSVKQWILFAALSISVPILVYNLFVHFFYLMLPRGIFW